MREKTPAGAAMADAMKAWRAAAAAAEATAFGAAPARWKGKMENACNEGVYACKGGLNSTSFSHNGNDRV